MNVPNEDLDKWRGMAMRARSLASGVHSALEFHTNPAKQQDAKHWAGEIRDIANALITRMDLAGAEPSYEMPSHRIPLRLLDTPASRRYLEALREARTAAIAMDSERYSPGEAFHCGTPAACEMDLIVCVREMEIFGVSEAPHAKGKE